MKGYMRWRTVIFGMKMGTVQNFEEKRVTQLLSYITPDLDNTYRWVVACPSSTACCVPYFPKLM